MKNTLQFCVREVAGDSILLHSPRFGARLVTFDDHELSSKDQVAKSFERFVGKDVVLEFPDEPGGRYRIGMDVVDFRYEIRASMSDFKISGVAVL
jgi:hypothetical protein